MTIIVKYCGGCNPRYNRAEAVRDFLQDFPDMQVVSNHLADFLLVVCGCSSACADYQHLHGRLGVFVVSGPEDWNKIRKELEQRS